MAFEKVADVKAVNIRISLEVSRGAESPRVADQEYQLETPAGQPVTFFASARRDVAQGDGAPGSLLYRRFASHAELL